MPLLFLLLLPLLAFAQNITLQILGSGGPEISDRASSSYLIWIDGKARVLVDAGGGSFLRFGQSGAKIEDLQLIAITHLHIDHSVDLPAFMKAGYFTPRTKPLPLLGTVGKGDFPDIVTFTQRLFGKQGAYAYMQDILTPYPDSFRLKPFLLDQHPRTITITGIKISTVGVNHGSVPAIAYAFEIEGKKIVFTGDTSAQSNHIIRLAQNADYFIAHHAIPQTTGSIAKTLHMTPERIGVIVQKAHVKNLILSHRMKRTLGHEPQSEAEIRKAFRGNIIWAEDLMKIVIQEH